MFQHNKHDDKPCPHMRTLVSALADDALSGLPRWFTTHHVAGCPRCRNGLAYFQALSLRLRSVGDMTDAEMRLTPEQWAAAEAAWEQVEREQKPAIQS